jgi:hypothetical protein
MPLPFSFPVELIRERERFGPSEGRNYPKITIKGQSL